MCTLLYLERQEYDKAFEKFNKGRLSELTEVQDAKEKFEGKDTIKYFNSIIDILKKYNIDAQGFFEYMRSIIEHEGIDIEKLWKEDIAASEKRYERCLIFDFDSKTYLLDSIDKSLNVVDKEKIDKKIFIFNPEENEYPYYGG